MGIPCGGKQATWNDGLADSDTGVFFIFPWGTVGAKAVSNGAFPGGIQQAQFLRECWRVARKGIFITTPNRWFPVEFHTVLPLAHWLPASVFRRLLVGIGKEFFAREENLNLMSGRSLSAAAEAAGIPTHRVSGCQLAGWTTNLLLIALKA